MKPIVVVGVAIVLLALAGSSRVGAQADRARLASAFAQVDRIFTEFTVQAHVPGAAWGVVVINGVDGELAHAGATGVRDVATKAPVEDRKSVV